MVDRIQAARYAAVLNAAADEGSPTHRWYLNVQGDIETTVLANADAATLQSFQVVMPPDAPRSSGGDLYHGVILLRAAAAWLAHLASGPNPDAPRLTAATDLMEQVAILLDDPDMTPAAPIMLAGAALEELLRDMVETAELTYSGRAGLDTYSKALRTAELITRQQAKDITAIAGARNAAAHGQFGELSPEQARLVAQHVNLLLAQLTTQQDDEPMSPAMKRVLSWGPLVNLDPPDES